MINNKYVDNQILNDYFSGSFTSLKIRYADTDNLLTKSNIYKMNDKINVFLNFENPLKHLSMIMNLEEKILSNKEFSNIIISNMINYIAHYKRFFVNNTFDTKVYLYMTDIDSNEFHEYKYNEDYRSYYLMKYNNNPKFNILTTRLRKDIFDTVSKICEFIPNVYFIKCKNIEGSLLPMIIAEKTPDRKNIIFTSDLYETQYEFLDNFDVYYIKRGATDIKYCSNVPEFVDAINRTETNSLTLYNSFSTYPLYCTLLSVIGDRKRSIEGISGLGIYGLFKLIEAGLMDHLITKDTTSPNLIADLFQDEVERAEFINNYFCTSFSIMYKELTDGDKSSIYSQLVDRRDDNSLMTLNNTKFANHPLILDGML